MMQRWKVSIEPRSAFATSLRGDTLFGQLCWMIRYRYGEKRLDTLLNDYTRSPFLIVSDAFGAGYLPKPILPPKMLGEDPEKKKENRKKSAVEKSNWFEGKFASAIPAERLGNDGTVHTTMHNSINYRSSRTQGDRFAPFAQTEIRYADKEIYALIDEERFGPEELQEVFTLLGESGYGKDSTTGKGRFDVLQIEPELLPRKSSRFHMALSPFVAQGIKGRLYAQPFTRFGKTGGERARGNVFKKPILMADTASVVVFDDAVELHYVGRGISDISPRYTDVVHQGYAMTIPITGELHED